MREFTFLKALVLEFKKIKSEDATKFIHSNFYLNSKAETIINKSNIDDEFESNHSTIISNKQKYLRKSSGWIINSVVNHTINILNSNHVAGSRYFKLLNELHNDYPLSSKKKC